MQTSYHQLLAHIAAATFALKESGDLAALLAKGGFSKERHAEGEKLVKRGEHLIEDKVNAVGEDRIREHSLHAAVAEVEMWLQVVGFSVSSAEGGDALADLLRPHDLHTHDHTTTALAHALRAVSLIRCDDRFSAALGGEKRSRDHLGRGLSLLKKAFKAAEIRLAPEGNEAEDFEVFGELGEVEAQMRSWMKALDGACASAAEKPRALGRLGHAPQDVGIPLGGAGYNIVLHEVGQGAVPDPTHVVPCSGWSIGRQGRNSENLGRGGW